MTGKYLPIKEDDRKNDGQRRRKPQHLDGQAPKHAGIVALARAESACRRETDQNHGSKKPEEWLEKASPPEKTKGNFKLFLGYAPGVGKTFSMLSEGIRRAQPR